MENEQGLLSGLVSEYDLGDLSEEEEEGEDLHRTDEDQDAGTQEGDDRFGADAEEALLRAQVTTSQFATPVGTVGTSPALNELWCPNAYAGSAVHAAVYLFAASPNRPPVSRLQAWTCEW